MLTVAKIYVGDVMLSGEHRQQLPIQNKTGIQKRISNNYRTRRIGLNSEEVELKQGNRIKRKKHRIEKC